MNKDMVQEKVRNDIMMEQTQEQVTVEVYCDECERYLEDDEIQEYEGGQYCFDCFDELLDKRFGQECDCCGKKKLGRFYSIDDRQVCGDCIDSCHTIEELLGLFNAHCTDYFLKQEGNVYHVEFEGEAL